MEHPPALPWRTCYPSARRQTSNGVPWRVEGYLEGGGPIALEGGSTWAVPSREGVSGRARGEVALTRDYDRRPPRRPPCPRRRAPSLRHPRGCCMSTTSKDMHMHSRLEYSGRGADSPLYVYARSG